METFEALVTIVRAAECLGVHENTIRNLITRGELPAVRIGARSTRVPLDAVQKIMNARQDKVAD